MRSASGAWGAAVARAAAEPGPGPASRRAAARARWTRWAQERAPGRADEAIATTPVSTARGTEVGACAWAASTLGSVLTAEVVAHAPPQIMERPSAEWCAWAVNEAGRQAGASAQASPEEAQAMLATWRWRHHRPPLGVVAVLGPDRAPASEGEWGGATRVERRARARRRHPADDAGHRGGAALGALCRDEEARVRAEIEAQAARHPLGGALEALRARWVSDPEIEEGKGSLVLSWEPRGATIAGWSARRCRTEPGSGATMEWRAEYCDPGAVLAVCAQAGTDPASEARKFEAAGFEVREHGSLMIVRKRLRANARAGAAAATHLEEVAGEGL